MVKTRIAAYVGHLSAGRGAGAYDLLHAQDGIGANALADLTERGAIPGYAATIHHVDHWPSAAVNALQRRAICCASLRFCVSRLWQTRLAQDYGVRAEVIGNGVDLERFSTRATAVDAQVQQRLGLRPGAPLIVSVGGIEPRKNSLRLLRAFCHLRVTYPRAQWVIVGGASLLDHSAYRASFHEEMARSGVQTARGDIVITGPVADAEVPALLRLADVVAYPSIHEGFGLVVIEALACGARVVVSRIPPFTEYLDDADVIWAAPDDVDSIAAALARAVRRPKPAQIPAACGTFSWSKCAALHVTHYQQWLERRAALAC